jgi:hypothetical protein
MSDVGNALSGGGSSASGVNDQTFADATLGDQIMGGTGDFGGSPSAAGPTQFNQFSDIANALSSGAPAGASPTAAQSIAMSPPAAAAATGGDPVGAASGTQSSTTPGSSPADQNQQQQTGQNKNQPDQNQYAPQSATDQLRVLLRELSGKPTGPTGPVPAAAPAPFALPTLAPGQTGRPSFTPAMIGGMPNEGGIDNLPGLVPGETGPPSGRRPGDALDQVAGAPPAEARLPPDAATQPGRDVTVRKAAPQAMPAPQNEPGEVAPGGPALPTRKPTQPPDVPQPAQAAEPPQAAPQPTPPPPQLLQDITGASTGAPIPLAQLAQVAMALLPLIGMFGGGGRGRRPGFQGMRGFRPFGSPGGLRGGGFHPGRFGHPAWRGEWPYHHPEHGWHMHPFHPGGGWLPLNPIFLQGLGGGQQGGQPGAQAPNALDPDRPPKETGAEVGPPDQVGSSGAIPGVSAKEVDDYTRQVAQKYNIDPNVASKVLAQESSYGQARKPGDKGTSFGPFQLHFAEDGNAMGDQFRRDTGLDPRDPRTWKAQIDYAMKQAAQGGWKPWTTTMNKLGMNQWSGINRTFAGQPYSKTIDPARDIPAYSIGNAALPPSSRPMVAGP